MTGLQPEHLPEPGPDDPARITPEDVERAKVAWEKATAPEFKHLLDAEPAAPA